jgi:hypothetical protein
MIIGRSRRPERSAVVWTLGSSTTVRARAMHTRPRTHTRTRVAQLDGKGCGLRGARGYGRATLVSVELRAERLPWPPTLACMCACPHPSHGALLAGCHRATQARSERMQVGGLGQEARAAWVRAVPGLELHRADALREQDHIRSVIQARRVLARAAAAAAERSAASGLTRESTIAQTDLRVARQAFRDHSTGHAVRHPQSHALGSVVSLLL